MKIEQFNLQTPDVVQLGFEDGWFKPEYNPRSGRSRRWMSDDAALRIQHGGRDVVVTVTRESPMPY